MTLEVGTRVRVKIVKTIGWNAGAVESMNGCMGVVDSVKPAVNPWGRQSKLDSPYCVRFDVPAKPWHSNQRPVAAFHFNENELEIL